MSNLHLEKEGERKEEEVLYLKTWEALGDENEEYTEGDMASSSWTRWGQSLVLSPVTQEL